MLKFFKITTVRDRVSVKDSLKMFVLSLAASLPLLVLILGFAWYVSGAFGFVFSSSKSIIPNNFEGLVADLTMLVPYLVGIILSFAVIKNNYRKLSIVLDGPQKGLDSVLIKRAKADIRNQILLLVGLILIVGFIYGYGSYLGVFSE